MYSRGLNEVRELFHSFLRRNGLKKTHQKDVVLEAFLGAEGHMSVEDVYALVKKSDERIGIVTVFRTLKSLTACGIAREINLGDGLTRFEHSYRHPDHHHIVCRQCRATIEFVSPELEKLQQKIVAEYQFEPVLRRFQIYGLCKNCRERIPSAREQDPDSESVFARDALRMALELERQGIEFYRDAAARNQDPAGREVLLRVAELEERHIGRLEARLQKVEQGSAGIRRVPTFLHFDAGELRKLFPDLAPYEATGELRMDAQRSLEMALALEERSAGFIRDFAQMFAEQEMAHARLISRQAPSWIF